MNIRPYQQLIVWQEAHKLCLRIYEITDKFPQGEKFRLVDQMCRSSSSIPTNIAEGSGKKSLKEKGRFYEIAACSLEELSYQCLLSKDLKYILPDQFVELDDHLQRTSYLLTKLRQNATNNTPR